MSKITAKQEIQRLESIYNETEALLQDLEQVLLRLEDNAPRFLQLQEYYYSEAWGRDHEAAAAGAFADIECGILSEDLFYNQLGDRQQYAIRMMEIALSILKS